MVISAKYVHTNLIARDWRALSSFYQQVFGCIPVPPERDYQGEKLAAGTGGDYEAKGYRQTEAGHLTKVCPLAAQEILHPRMPVSQSVTKEKYPFAAHGHSRVIKVLLHPAGRATGGQPPRRAPSAGFGILLLN